MKPIFDRSEEVAYEEYDAWRDEPGYRKMVCVAALSAVAIIGLYVLVF